MQKLIEEITACVKQEYYRATKKYGERHASSHEAYAVILEEFEEAMEDIDAVKTVMNSMWHSTKENESTIGIAKMIERSAIMAAAEMVQVAAMAVKAQNGYLCDDHD